MASKPSMSDAKWRKILDLQDEIGFLKSLRQKDEAPTFEELDLKDELQDLWDEEKEK